MPELPEVETIRRVLEPQIKGVTITTVTVNRRSVIGHPTAEEFCQTLTGQTIKAMTRRGKFLSVLMESGDYFTLHLRMTGCLLLTPADYPAEKHTHIVFHLSSGDELRFSDTRRFGRFWLFHKGENDTYSGIDKLGLEPFDTDLTASYLQQHFGKRKKAVKECLLDQSVIAGIGNIYSDEILFSAMIHPARSANSLTKSGVGTSCCRCPGTAGLLHRKERSYPGGISGKQGTGLPQYAVPPGLRTWRGRLLELWSYAPPYGGWRQGQHVLSKMPD